MRTVLIVEDEAATLRTIRLILRKHGYNVLMAGDGVEALDLIGRVEGEPGMQVDLLITDLQMPRMNGLELLAELDKMERSIPALVISAFSDRQNTLKAFRNRKCYEFIDKPLDEENLLAGLRTVIAKHEAEAERMRQTATDIVKSGGEEVKGEFLSAIAHELNTPMNGIIGGVELIKEGQLNDEQRHFAEAIDVSAKRLNTRISEIMELADLNLGGRKPKRETFDLKQALATILLEKRKAAEAKGLDFKVAWRSPALENLEGDPSLICGVVARLLDNAIKFTNSGDLRFNADCRKGEGDQAELCLIVKDSGDGIPADKLPAIFDSFAQADSSLSRRYEGLGLGLSYCRKAARMLGGVIGVDSVEGKGSEFWVRVPMRLGKPATPSKLESHRKPKPVLGRGDHIDVFRSAGG